MDSFQNKLVILIYLFLKTSFNIYCTYQVQGIILNAKDSLSLPDRFKISAIKLRETRGREVGGKETHEKEGK